MSMLICNQFVQHDIYLKAAAINILMLIAEKVTVYNEKSVKCVDNPLGLYTTCPPKMADRQSKQLVNIMEHTTKDPDVFPQQTVNKLS